MHDTARVEGFKRTPDVAVSRRAVQREYGALAAGYDARWSRYVEVTTAMALARMPLTPHARVVDVGCGTGWLLGQAIAREPSLEVVGIDLTAEMLSRAASRLGARGLLLQGSADAIPLPDASMDVVVSTSALHYMTKVPSVLRELRRVLVSGGTLVVTDWCADFRTMRWLDRVLRVVDPAHGQTLTCGELSAALKDAGFTGVTADSAKIDRFWGIMTVVGRA